MIPLSAVRRFAPLGLLVLALAGVLVTLQGLRAGAQEAENQRVWSAPDYGFEWTRPDDSRWKFIPEDEWGRRFGGDRPAYLMCMIGKWEDDQGELGGKPFQVLATVFAYDVAEKIQVAGKSMDPGNVKGLADANFKQDSESRYKDVKEIKKPGPRRAKFAREVFAFSFVGVHVKSGSVTWKDVWFIRGNKKYTFLIDINCPAGNEETMRAEIDKLLDGLKLTAPKAK